MIQIGSLDTAYKAGYLLRMNVLGVFQIKSKQYVDVFRPNHCMFYPKSQYPTIERLFKPQAGDIYWWRWDIITKYEVN